MSTLPQISTADAVLQIKRLIDNHQGDPGRLQYISEVLQKGRKLFHSDQIYLEKKISAQVIPAQIKKPSETEERIKIVKKMLALNFGDSERLRHILQTLDRKKILYNSDKLYLESKTAQLREYLAGRRLKPGFKPRISIKPTIEQIKPKPQATPETTFEEIEQAISPEQPEEIVEEIPPPKPKQTSDLFDLIEDTSKVDLEIQQEQEKISELERNKEKNKRKHEELSQLIAYRQEFEKKLNLEKEYLQKEIQIEQEKVKEKDKMVEELIKNQAKLIQSKAEREVLMEQIKIDKEKSDQELKQAQEELELLKQQFEDLQNKVKLKKQILDDQIKEETEKINKLKEDLD